MSGLGWQWVDVGDQGGAVHVSSIVAVRVDGVSVFVDSYDAGSRLAGSYADEAEAETAAAVYRAAVARWQARQT